jgi:hypothetical protein
LALVELVENNETKMVDLSLWSEELVEARNVRHVPTIQTRTKKGD